MVTGKRQNDDEGPERLLARAKSNIGRDDGGFGYALDVDLVDQRPDITASRIRWCGQLEGSARDLLADLERTHNADDAKKEKAAQVRKWLGELLEEGAKTKAEIEGAATELGFSNDQLDRAKKTLGVRSFRRGDGGKRGQGTWHWQLKEPSRS